jgi:hypothetical protein
MVRPKTKPTVITRFKRSTPDIIAYFEHLPSLINDYPWEVALGYMFWRIEQAQNNTLYCGIVKIHSTNAELTREAVDNERIRRQEFKNLFATVFGKRINQRLIPVLTRAEKVRDRVIHGKKVKDEDKREAILDLLDFAEGFNLQVKSLADFKPFGSLRGFKGSAKSLDKSTTRWVLKGMGLNPS